MIIKVHVPKSSFGISDFFKNFCPYLFWIKETFLTIRGQIVNLGEKMAIELPLFLGLLFLGVGAIILAMVVINYTKQLLVNSVFGIIALLVINGLADMFNVPIAKISITFVHVAITAVFGLAGVGLLVIMNILGIHI